MSTPTNENLLESGLGTNLEESPIRLAGRKGITGGTRSEAEMGPASMEESGLGANLEESPTPTWKSPRRSRNRSEVVTIWWRDIPTQVNGLSGTQIEKRPLSHRFLWAAQRAAKKADLLDSHAFTRQTRRTSTPFDPVDGSLGEVVSLEAQRLELLYTDDLLTRLVEAGGLAKNTAAVARPRLRVVRQTETDI